MSDDELESNIGILDDIPEAEEKKPPARATKTSKRKKPVGMPETVRIVLEENDAIPPTGLFVGLNGRGYLIRPGEPVNVPRGVVDILDHAIMSTAMVDPSTQQVVGYRDRMRYPYRKL